jgi:PAS domain S-box-containing protein
MTFNADSDEDSGKRRLLDELASRNQSLAASEANYRYLLESTDTGYAILDEQGRVLEANARFVRMTGRGDAAEVVGRRVLEWTAPHDIERNAAEVRKCLETGSARGLQIDYLMPDGRLTPIEIDACIMETRQGKRILALHWDISEERRQQRAREREFRTLKHLLHSSDHERRLIAYEIHDGLAQQLAAAHMQFQAFDYLKNTSPADAAKAYDAGIALVRQAHFEARRLIAGVRPPVLDESGVVQAISHLVHEMRRSGGPRIRLRRRVAFDRLDPTLENAIYRIVQEGLSNAVMHSKSEAVRASLWQKGDQVCIEIRDWGVGFDPESVPKSRFGLEGIRQRARLLGGKCLIESRPGGGSRIVAKLPIALRDEG